MQHLLCVLLIAATAALGYGQVTGGVRPYSTDLNDSNVVFAVQAIEDYLKANVTATSLVSASKQTVAGYMYTYEIAVRETSGMTYICSVRVWTRDWLEASEAVQVNGDPQCRPTRG